MKSVAKVTLQKLCLITPKYLSHQLFFRFSPLHVCNVDSLIQYFFIYGFFFIGCNMYCHNSLTQNYENHIEQAQVLSSPFICRFSWNPFLYFQYAEILIQKERMYHLNPKKLSYEEPISQIQEDIFQVQILSQIQLPSVFITLKRST